MEKRFSQKELAPLLDVSHVALLKALRDAPFEFEEVQGSTKKVKHYKLSDLPQRYIDKLKEQGIEINKSLSNEVSLVTSKNYLCASSPKQKKAVLKSKLVELYLKRDVGLSASKWLEEILYANMEFDLLGSVTYKQLSDWRVKYIKARADGLNLVDCFIDTRGNKPNTTALSVEQQEMAKRFFLKKSHILISNIHFIMKEHFGASMPSYDSLNNFYRRHRRANPQLYIFALSPDKWKNHCMVAIGDESEKAKYRNHFWEFDATPADIICSDNKRYTILGLIDVATRRPIFIVEDSNSSFAVSRLLREGILRFGIPENIVVDNGKEFVSQHFESICINLGIQVHVTPPFSGDKKPFVERVFGTLARGLFRELDGFIGHNVAMREEIQARKSFAHKIMSKLKAKQSVDEDKEVFIEAWKLHKDNNGLELNTTLSKEELQRAIDVWVAKKYEQSYHGTLKAKPIVAWNSYYDPVKSISDESMLDLLLGKSLVRKVGKKGLSIDGVEYWANELESYMAKSVKVMLRDDMGSVIVYDIESMSLICQALNHEKRGCSREAAAKAKASQNRLVRQMAKTVKEAVEFDDPTMMSVLEAKKDEIVAQSVAVHVRTPVVDMLLEESHILQAKDEEELEGSNHYDFSKKDENGIPTKVLEGGRPAFVSFYDDFMWCLRNDSWSKRDEASKKKRPDTYEKALVDYEKEIA